MIALTAFDVNDQVLTLRYKIMNRSDHDVWFCEGVNIVGKLGESDCEIYMDSDARSLVIAKRIEGPMELVYARPPSIEGRYVRLRAGQERIGSLSLAVPVTRYTLFTSKGPDVDYAVRLLLRVGLYDEDLVSGQDAEQINVTYRRTAYLSGDEHYLEIGLDGVFIKVVPLRNTTDGPVTGQAH